MHELVAAAIDATGGLERWRRVRQISLDFAVSGAGLQARGPVGETVSRLPMRATVNAAAQEVSFRPYLAPGRRGVYHPDRTVVFAEDGTVFEELDGPREDLQRMPAGVRWSGSQLLYFLGYSLWMYHTLPFSFLAEGLSFDEVEPWVEGGETWRGLRVVYPDSFPAHSTEQIHYFDEAGLMRRQDYTVDVRQDLSVAHYLNEYREFDGFAFPTERRIHPCGPDRSPVRNRVLITADLSDFEVAFGDAE